MKRQLILSSLLIFIVLPFVSADIVTPGFHGITINNRISNIADFPEYVFVSGPSSDGGIGLGMCPLKVIEERGVVDQYYKFCTISVYAISKANFSLDAINEINNAENYELSVNKLNSLEKIEVLSGLNNYKEVSILSPQTNIERIFEINLDSLIQTPSQEKVKTNFLIYFYIFVPLVALIAVGVIIWKRKHS